MTPSSPCARCGNQTGPEALWGLCYKCLYNEAVNFPAAEHLSAGQKRRFGAYELGAQLGRGGMGVVYEAVHLRLRRTVALKMILDSEASSPLALQRFRFEAETAARLDHPNIVPIYEVDEWNGQHFLSMKFIAGQTLREKIASGEFCLKPKYGGSARSDSRTRTATIVRLMVTVARAVDHAHGKGVLHRDLKPGNILVDPEGQPHLTDFGLAKVIETEPDTGRTPAASLTASGTTLGTPSYMSPEQAAGHCVTAASDIYSLGAILYEMLTGAPPLQGATVLETLRLVADEQPRSPSTRNATVDRDLDTICLKCLEKLPQARYISALGLAEDLERWLRQEPIRARPAGIALRAGRWLKRNPAAAALILCLFTGFTVAMGLLHLAHQRQRRLEMMRAIDETIFTQDIESLWSDTNKAFIHIHSERLAQLADATPRPPSPAVRLTYAAVVQADPFGQAKKFAPLLATIEDRMAGFCGFPVLIDLRLYKFDGDGRNAPVARGEVDFQRLGPLRYIQARASQPGLELVASEQELEAKTGVMYARKELGITNLSQVAGRRIAFANTNSTISFLTKVVLARAGLNVSDFSVTTNLAFTVWSNDPTGRVHFESDSEAYAHREVMRQVLANAFDLGEGPRRAFELNKHRGKGLIELASFPVMPDAIAARPKLSADLVDAFRQSLLSMHGKPERLLFARLKNSLAGYGRASDRDYDVLRSAMTNEIPLFETPRAVSASAMNAATRNGP